MGKRKTKAIQIDLGTVRQNQVYSKPCVNLAYSELWYIQNPDICKTNSEHIQNPGILKTLAY